ncbi:MAG TPA: hypothetical protein VF677_02220 [Flavobacterium sp.]|jgi:hypothetical protein
MNTLKNILAIINSIIMAFKVKKYIIKNPNKIQYYLYHENTMKGMKLFLIFTFGFLAYVYNLINTLIYLKSNLSITINKISSISFIILLLATAWFLNNLYKDLYNDRISYLRKRHSMKKN